TLLLDKPEAVLAQRHHALRLEVAVEPGVAGLLGLWLCGRCHDEAGDGSDRQEKENRLEENGQASCLPSSDLLPRGATHFFSRLNVMNMYLLPGCEANSVGRWSLPGWAVHHINWSPSSS